MRVYRVRKRYLFVQPKMRTKIKRGTQTQRPPCASHSRRHTASMCYTGRVPSSTRHAGVHESVKGNYSRLVMLLIALPLSPSSMHKRACEMSVPLVDNLTGVVVLIYCYILRRCNRVHFRSTAFLLALQVNKVQQYSPVCCAPPQKHDTRVT